MATGPVLKVTTGYALYSPGLPSGLVASRSAADGVKSAVDGTTGGPIEPPFVMFHAPVQTYKALLLLISSRCMAIEPFATPVKRNVPLSVVNVWCDALPSPAVIGDHILVASLFIGSTLLPTSFTIFRCPASTYAGYRFRRAFPPFQFFMPSYNCFTGYLSARARLSISL